MMFKAFAARRLDINQCEANPTVVIDQSLAVNPPRFGYPLLNTVH